MMLSIPTGIDLRGPLEKRAHINSMRKRLNAFRYMRRNRVVQFIRNGGM
jgi:hypothetical protein